MDNDNLTEIIIRQVLDKHGEIKDLKEVKARNIFDNRWRINVWTEYNNAELLSAHPSQRIEYSYFIHVDDAGVITKCDPPLGEKYVPAEHTRLV